PHGLVPALPRRPPPAAVGRLPQGDLLRPSRGTDQGRRPFLRLHRQVRDPLPHARPRGPRPDVPIRGCEAWMSADDEAIGALAHGSGAARRDPGLAVLEGFHALKHALRFGAEVQEAATSDPEGLERLAGELAPDVASGLTAVATPTAPELLAELV